MYISCLMRCTRDLVSKQRWHFGPATQWLKLLQRNVLKDQFISLSLPICSHPLSKTNSPLEENAWLGTHDIGLQELALQRELYRRTCDVPQPVDGLWTCQPADCRRPTPCSRLMRSSVVRFPWTECGTCMRDSSVCTVNHAMHARCVALHRLALIERVIATRPRSLVFPSSSSRPHPQPVITGRQWWAEVN